MNYNFPIIEHIDQVLPAIEGRKDIIVAEKEGGFTVVNYLVNLPDTFDCFTRRECRGIKFNTKTGEIIQRPFHKFFNVNEREETAANKINMPLMWVEEKHDGSMVAPIILPDNGYLRITTKMGINPISMQAETFIADKPEYMDFCRDMLEQGNTPIFEWCSRQNRIVLDYPEDRLILLAVRDNITGQYLTIGDSGALDFVPPRNHEWLGNVKDAKNIEGAVLVDRATGHRVKLKSDWYVNLHRIKSEISYEHNLVQAILGNRVDDLLPVMDAELKEKVEKYQYDFFEAFMAKGEYLQKLFDEKHIEDRKAFALSIQEMPPLVKSILFQTYDKKCAHTALMGMVNKYVVRHERWKEFKDTIGVSLEWTGGMFSE